MGLLSADHMPRGVVAITLDLANSAVVGDTETMIYTLSFTAAPKRIYKVCFRAAVVDTNGTGDNANSAIRYAKNAADIRCRWASGASVTTSSSSLGLIRATVFDDDSVTAGGADASFYLLNPPRGQITVGITLRAARASATYGQVGLYPNAGSHLAIEDVGPHSE
ncbi:hypothetical protein SEA_JANUS_24 [Streptomyces phage Janus]|uniref:DUF7298 domain-containing protein n=1 Tax=Streptomyces phage Janus TaxID=2510525 RepID=A0A411CPR4_9CAUD|nr:hypothetical protein KGG75_gp24 [Streptomyces phage Janus]ATI18887.1 hypothetical protein SEA_SQUEAKYCLEAN_24 [Streptomyces phage SqueakyClean]QAY15928.1 hypothetical protein SEA_JANUS_24 [Streptomyces phage Janus]QFG10692.1 hypothetical protein SEA_ANIMUS_24 [Streptomyces phage Animus]